MRIFSALFLAAFLSIAAFPQSDEPGKSELMIWGGYAPVVRTFDPNERTWDAQYGMAGLRFSRRWNTANWVNIKYTVDFIPVAILSYPDQVVTPTGPGTVRIDRVKRTRYAYSVSPFGLQANLRPRKKVQPFIGGSLAAFAFNKNTPNDLGRRLNFGTEFGAGVEYRLPKKRAVTFGYKFYHISNASQGEINPGYDAQLFYIGYTFRGR
ncbi:MAG: acyloxyacyl hydrolase [Pyrinomonadaceae bacterium]